MIILKLAVSIFKCPKSSDSVQAGHGTGTHVSSDSCTLYVLSLVSCVIGFLIFLPFPGTCVSLTAFAFRKSCIVVRAPAACSWYLLNAFAFQKSCIVLQTRSSAHIVARTSAGLLMVGGGTFFGPGSSPALLGRFKWHPCKIAKKLVLIWKHSDWAAYLLFLLLLLIINIIFIIFIIIIIMCRTS